MGAEKRELTEELIEEKMKRLPPQSIRYVDPMKMAAWTIDTACEMADHCVSKRTIERAIENHELNAFKPGKETCVIPSEFITWLKRQKK